jgi:mono/diheme cytochrome c family protein
MRGFLVGFVAALAVLAVLFFSAVKTGQLPARADGAPLPGERWVARTALKAAIAREAPKPPYPYPSSDPEIANGATLYVQNCAVCHGTAHTTPNAIARGLGPIRPPQFARDSVDDDPEGVTYWKIEHGIRFTGMPAYSPALDERSIWALTYFLKRVPKDLPAAANAIWEDPSHVAPPTPMPAPPTRPPRRRTAS